MSDTTNGWPGKPGVPRDPEKDGWHWVVSFDAEKTIVFWHGENQGNEGYWDGYPLWIAQDWTYLGPVLSHDQATALQARVTELEAETKKAKFIHQYEVKELQARATKLTRLVVILVENDPEDMAADAVTVLDVWRKEAREFLARHARLDARQTGMEKMRENEAAEILAALEGKGDE